MWPYSAEDLSLVNMEGFGGPRTFCIIGAGFSGLCTAIQIKQQLNLNTFTIFDQNDDVGGTWLVNTYPGCACDIPSHLYSLSFEPNPFWSKAYASQEEILGYLQAIAKKHDLRQRIKFQHQVVGTEWDENVGKWKVSVLDMQSGETTAAEFDIIISAIGAFRLPNIPDVFHSFSGPKMHTARWDPKISLENKVVGVIGSGASGIQLIPQIVDKVKRLICYQRKPAWIIPKCQFTHSPFLKWAFAKLPRVRQAFRKSLFWCLELTHPIYKVDTAMHKQAGKLAKRQLYQQIRDPILRQKLTPNYEFGCKRVIPSQDYYPALAKQNVTVITSEIASVTEDAIITEDGGCEKPDVLILATGFRVHDFFDSRQVRGRGGEDVGHKFNTSGMWAYAGTVCHSLPNAFIILGPNSVAGHTSVLLGMEVQVNWTIKVIQEMIARNARIISVKKSAEDDYMAYISEQMKSTVWGSYQCGSYFADESGRISTLWPGTSTSFKNMLKSVDCSHFDFS